MTVALNRQIVVDFGQIILDSYFIFSMHRGQSQIVLCRRVNIINKVTGTSLFLYIQSLTKQIHQNMAQPGFSVGKLAEKLALSRSSLQRKCKEKLNDTPIAYIRKVRMNHAMHLLKQDIYTISEIAYGTGFESLAYFSRTFKNFHGENPSAIRN